MQGFNGFPPKGRLIKIPGIFFSDLLPQIDDLVELKVTLYCFWLLQLKEGEIAYVRRVEIENDEVFMAGLAARKPKQKSVLLEGLERAVTRGTFLRAYVNEGEDFYFVNTERGRATIEAIRKGEWHPQEVSAEVHLIVERPNIFRLYEQNIGPLTPLIAEHLTDLEKEYSLDWVKDAIEVAVMGNIRKLNYIVAVLKRWKEQGRSKSDDTVKSGEWYISGKYSDEIEF